MEKPLYPLKYMHIIQGYGEKTHVDSYAIDDAGKDEGIDNIVAPFTGIIKKIYKNDANEVWIESIQEVEYPDGTIDYMTMMFAHSNDVSNLNVGQIIKRGEVFYSEGTKGNITENQCHFECGKGKFTDPGWHKNSEGYWIINNSKKPQECLWIDETITIINSNNYNFKIINNYTLSTPKKEKQIENQPRLIFTCIKDDIYAIKLKKDQQLFLK